MAAGHPIPTTIVAALILIFGIIHFGVGVGIVRRYHQYHDVFQQPVGLCGYDIFIGIFGVAVGILCLFDIFTQLPALSKIAAVMSLMLGIFAIGSFIAALAINSTAISFIKNRITDNMNAYISDQDAINIIDGIQTNWQCCGTLLWLDWARVSLGTTGIVGRRRRDLSLPLTPLTRALRQVSSVTPGGNIYNLPSTYTINLPLSCCINGGTSSGNSLGGYCVYSASNSSSSFNVGGCLAPVANICVSIITGVVVINTCMAILALVMIPLLIDMFPQVYIHANPNKTPSKKEIKRQQKQQQQQQVPYYGAGYSTNGNVPNQYYPDPNSGYYMNGNVPNQYNASADPGYYMNSNVSNQYYPYPEPVYAIYQV